jgi:predicted TIM-barrel fold metal-dependent hydrolase
MPSEILYSQVLTTTHREREWIKTRHVTGVDCILWSNDFPHREGCFPESKIWIDYIFAGSDLSPLEKYKVLGGNAARLYGMDPVKSKEEKKRVDISGLIAAVA